jgi:hypothetical protein
MADVRMRWLAADSQLLQVRHFIAGGRGEPGAPSCLSDGACGMRRSALVDRVLLPPKDEFDRAARRSVRPSGQSLSVAIGAAIAAKAGLAFVQSHMRGIFRR